MLFLTQVSLQFQDRGELTAQLTEALRLNLNLGHIDSEYDEFISGRTDPVSGFPAPNVTSPSFNAATGEEDISDTAIFPTSPENTASVVLSYDFLGVSWADVNARLEMTTETVWSFTQ